MNGWMIAVKVVLGNKEMTVGAGRQCAKNEKDWRYGVAGNA